MKKLISVVLCLVLVFGIAAVPSAAEQTQSEGAITWDGDPVVFIQGFTGSPLVMNLGEEDETPVWGGDKELNVNVILESLPAILTGLTLYILGFEDLLVESFGTLAGSLLSKIECKPDGTSLNNVVPVPATADTASAKYLRENGKEHFIPEVTITDRLLEIVPEDSLFIFNGDWRMGQIDNADMLAEFIDGVLAVTGKQKVDIYALSHGGQTAAAYLYYYGTQAKVDNAVLNVPAIGGTTIVTGLLDSNPTNFDMHELALFASVLLKSEIDLRAVGYILPGGFLNRLVKTAFNECFLPYALYYGSVWDFMNTETYTKLKNEMLDPVESALLIEKADKMHYDCMANMGEGLRAAQAAGTDIFIMSNYGTRIGTGQAVDSDFVIDTACTSGSYTAAYGTRFAEDYVQQNTVCKDPTHNHISPTRTVDASTGFLPENTWYIYGQYHGQVAWDAYTGDMIYEMLLTDNIKDIYSDPRYPQFEIAQNPFVGVYAKFTNEKSGYFNSGSDTLLVRNLSEEYEIYIRSVKADGCSFEVDSRQVLAPGEETTITCTSLTNGDFFELDITYVRKGEVLSPAFTRTLCFSRAK